MKPVILLAALVVVGPHGSASAESTSPAPKADPAKGQRIATQVCAPCHGVDGNSVLAGNPSLAGQHAEYITKQLANFKSGARKNAVMTAMVAALSEQDMRNLAAYYTGKAPKPGAAKDKTLAELGQKIYRGGNAATGVPACAGCHEPDGAGIPSQFPRLAGQHSEYVLAQLKGFRSWERANDDAKMMRMISARLSDQEMQGLAEYVSGLR